MLVRVEPEQVPQSALVAVVQSEARDHLGDGEACTVPTGLQAHEPVSDAGQGRQQDAIRDLDVANAEG